MVKSKAKKQASKSKPPKGNQAEAKTAAKKSAASGRKKDDQPNTSVRQPSPKENGHPVLAKNLSVPVGSLGAAASSLKTAFELTEKIKELVKLAQEQGYLTYNDINDALPDNMVSPDELDDIYTKLRNLEVEIVDQAEVDRVKQPEPEEEEDKVRLDILDDPVRMYLKQMGQVPLLTREQEVEISKRIETAENELKRIIYSFGFAGKEHIALADKLISATGADSTAMRKRRTSISNWNSVCPTSAMRSGACAMS